MHYYEFLSEDYLEATSHGHIAVIAIPVIVAVISIIIWSKNHHPKELEGGDKNNKFSSGDHRGHPKNE